MTLSSRQKKWLKRIAILLIIRFGVGGILYYIVVYRFKEILQVAVKRESKGMYSFDADNIDVALFNRNITLDHIKLTCNDTLKKENYYSVQIPKIYLSIESFRELVFHKKFSVDSMAVISPEITAHITTKEKKENTHLSLQASKFMDALQKLVLHLEIRTLKIEDAAFAYYQNKTTQPFRGSHINFSVSNFSKKDKIRDYLFSADDIDLRITRQNWELPDGIHHLSFSTLHFSGKNQKFELDSLIFHSKGAANQNSLQLNADRIFFNSRNLQDIYLKEELSIDTVSFVHPVVSVQSANSKTSDTAAAINGAMSHLFKKISFKYIDIKDGQFSLGEKSGIKANYITQKTNLQLYNLALVPGGKPALTIDSIQLKLNKVNFITRDSMNQLSIGEFALNKNRLVLLHADYGPTIINKSPSSLRFATPILEIQDVSLDELLKKRLVGTLAELHKPVITVTGKEHSNEQAKSGRSMKDFFKTLHSLQELIEVDSFRIVDGQLNYSNAKNNLKANLVGMNSTILINRLLRSDSLIDIKRSLPNLNVNQILVKNRAINLQIDNYQFDGRVRYNESAGFSLKTGGTTLTGTGVSWRIFDWDMYANHKIILIQELNIGQLTAKMESTKNAGPKKEPKDLPVIKIGRLDIAKLNLAVNTAKNEKLDLTGKDICLDEINSEKHFFTWKNLLASFNDLRFAGSKSSVEIKNISLDNNYRHDFHNASFSTSDGNLKVQLPLLHLKLPLKSSDFSQPYIESLIIEKPLVSVSTDSGKTSAKKGFKMPLDLKADVIEIIDGSVSYLNTGKGIVAESKLNLRLKSVTALKSGPELLTWSQAGLDLFNARMAKGNLKTDLDSAKIVLSNGKIGKDARGDAEMTMALAAGWFGANAHINKADTTLININNLTGGFKNNSMRFGKDIKLDWKDLVEDVTINNGSGGIETKNFTSGAGLIKWDGKQEAFHAGDFFLLPKLTMQEAFKKAEWQSDYMTVKGKSLDIRGLSLNKNGRDTTLHVNRLELGNIDLMTARDKRLPLKHGIEKLMPTQLINNVKYPFEIDSLFMNESKVTVHEFSVITNQEGIIPLEKVNAVISNIKSNPGGNDSLHISASTVLMNNYIDHLNYSESYGDSLSFFTLHFHASPMILSFFSKATKPLAAIQLNSGNSDTLYADWVGNKYAAIGRMNFFYKHLSVQLLDKKDPGKKKFTLSVVNFLANSLVLKRKNTRESIVFFERDKEKFIFNYWVKTSLKGLLSSIGLKRSRKYLKEYASKQSLYSLPAFKR